jgi:hypothetical protein
MPDLPLTSVMTRPVLASYQRRFNSSVAEPSGPPSI